MMRQPQLICFIKLRVARLLSGGPSIGHRYENPRNNLLLILPIEDRVRK